MKRFRLNTDLAVNKSVVIKSVDIELYLLRNPVVTLNYDKSQIIGVCNGFEGDASGSHFVDIEFEDNSMENIGGSIFPGIIPRKMRHEGAVTVIEECELIELSLVT